MKSKVLIIVFFILTIMLMIFYSDVYVLGTGYNDIRCTDLINIKDSNGLFSELERKVVLHSNIIRVDYTISDEIDVKKIDLSFEKSEEETDVSITESYSNNFFVSIVTNSIGELKVRIICCVTLNDGNKLTLYDEIFIYSRCDYDFVSRASILDAKFYCYEFITNTNNPTFDGYREFYSNGSDSICNTNNINNINEQLINLQNSSSNICVSGTITWLDEEALEPHSAKNLIIDVIDEDASGDCHVLATTNTNANGLYYVEIPHSTFFENGGNNIKIRILSQGGNVKVVNNSGVVYNLLVDNPQLNFVGTSLTINFEININNYLSESDKEIVKSFRVHQAMNFGATYFCEKEGRLLPEVSVAFPATRTCFSNGKLYIIEKDKNDWDVMLHEYGHYVQSFCDISNSPGGGHTSGTCLNEKKGNKQEGMALAWGEGWATYFSISSQLEMNAKELHIKNVGDTRYTDTEDYGADYDIELITYDKYKYGESNESNIAAVLLDLADGINDENIEFGYDYIWNLIMNKKCKNMSEFINALYAEKTPFECAKIGEILTSLDVAPELTLQDDENLLNIVNQTFTWVSNGGTNKVKDYSNNLFSLIVYDKNGSLIFETSQTTNLYYSLNEEELRSIFSSNNNLVYLSIKAYQTTDFTTGPYISKPYILKLYNDECLISNYSSTINKNIELDKSGFNFLKINSNYSKYYEFFINSKNPLNVQIYDSSLNLICTQNVNLSLNNIHFIRQLGNGVYYVRINNPSNEVNTASFKIISRTTAYLTFNNQNDILLNSYNEISDYYYMNKTGIGFYEFKITGITQDGTAFICPANALRIYNNSQKNSSSLMEKYALADYANFAQNKSSEDSFIVCLTRMGYFYLDINISCSDLVSLKIEILPLDSRKIDIFNLPEDRDTLLTIINSQKKGDYFKSFEINHAGKFEINAFYNGTETENMLFVLAEKAYSSENDSYYINPICVYLMNDYNNIYNFTRNLTEGLYYIGFFNKNDTNNFSVSLERLVTQSGASALLVDPGVDWDCGSQINIIEMNSIDKSYNETFVTEGFTRIIYMNEQFGIPKSRLEYYWKSSDESIATITNYGTLFGKKEGTVKIMVSLKSDLSKVFVKQFTVIKDDGTGYTPIESNYTVKYSETDNGTFHLHLENVLCPYPWYQYYTWTTYIPCQNEDQLITNDCWGNYTVSGPCTFDLIGQSYVYNTKYITIVVIIHVTVTSS